MGNFASRVDNNQNLSVAKYFNRRFSHGDDLLIIGSLLKSGAKLDRADYNYLLGIIEDQKNKNEYVPLCEKIEETLSLISDKNAERGEKYVRYENCGYNNNLEHIYDTPEYGISGMITVMITFQSIFTKR
ncbi:hypothetical protein HET73_01510 [Wolbachia endosymbiont of Atemnus politus]|uniref:hypothetical protein n=1 Tax=Wolbachia endosymbiont of Atemnus politus TaxID=2682840 RepID=UPI001573BF5A|nr:hypothetical protein [Wolbachia endosymbiont of Atemnus politus]NSM56300.1 hypothetical protein [Wolbachia endosymbiont of Atemnus politus]